MYAIGRKVWWDHASLAGCALPRIRNDLGTKLLMASDSVGPSEVRELFGESADLRARCVGFTKKTKSPQGGRDSSPVR
jgi:hypothetical protein